MLECTSSKDGKPDSNGGGSGENGGMTPMPSKEEQVPLLKSKEDQHSPAENISEDHPTDARLMLIIVLSYY